MDKDGPNRLDRTLAVIFRPVAKLLIKFNIPLKSAVESLKLALVRAAEDRGAASDSLISLQTGLHRKDVKRLRKGGGETPTKKIPISGVSIVLSFWANDAAFRDSAGRPRRLMRKSDGNLPGFDALVRASKVDLAPATVLSELLSQGLVKDNGSDGLELLEHSFVPQSGAAMLDAFDATISDHLRIAARNATAPAGEPRQFDQVLRYSHLSETSVARLEAEARKKARIYLEDLNALAHRLQVDDDMSGLPHSGRFVTGVYIAPTPAGDTDDQETTKT